MNSKREEKVLTPTEEDQRVEEADPEAEADLETEDKEVALETEEIEAIDVIMVVKCQNLMDSHHLTTSGMNTSIEKRIMDSHQAHVSTEL